jgi:hypothetical protein
LVFVRKGWKRLEKRRVKVGRRRLINNLFILLSGGVRGCLEAVKRNEEEDEDEDEDEGYPRTRSRPVTPSQGL